MAGMTSAVNVDAVMDECVADLRAVLMWARSIRTNPNHTTTALQLADVVIQQTIELLAIRQEQLDRCNVGEIAA